MRALLIALLLAAAPAFAEAPPPPCPCESCAVACGDLEDDEPPSQAARDAAVVVPWPAAPPQKPKRARSRAVVELGALPGYMHLIGSDFLGAQLTLGVGGEAHRTGFVALARFGSFIGSTVGGVRFEHLTLAAAFVIPTGTRLHLTLGHQFGVLIVQEPHTVDGNAEALTMGGFFEPTVDLDRRGGRRLALVGRIAYDVVWVRGGDPNAVTANLGLTYSF